MMCFKLNQTNDFDDKNDDKIFGKSMANDMIIMTKEE